MSIYTINNYIPPSDTAQKTTILKGRDTQTDTIMKLEFAKFKPDAYFWDPDDWGDDE